MISTATERPFALESHAFQKNAAPYSARWSRSAAGMDEAWIPRQELLLLDLDVSYASHSTPWPDTSCLSRKGGVKVAIYRRQMSLFGGGLHHLGTGRNLAAFSFCQSVCLQRALSRWISRC